MPVSCLSAIMIIVIDGPSGAGKSSTAKAVAARAGLNLLDTGAFYRMATLLYLRGGSDMNVLLKCLNEVHIELVPNKTGLIYMVDGEDVTEAIRTPNISEHVSLVATNGSVRDLINARLRPLASTGNFIAEGRDLGTVVFPNADLKFWMTANLDERTQRRVAELRLAGHQVDEESIRENLAERDRIDSSRHIAPLERAKDAIDIDTTQLDFDQQVAFILEHYHKLQLKH
jgi:CMP/dCMP kinase